MPVQPIQKQLKQAVIDTASSGAQTIIAAVAGQLIYVYALYLTQSVADTVQINDGTTNFTGVMTTAAGVPINLTLLADCRPRFVCASGNAFIITLGGNHQTSGTVWYVQA